MTGLLFVWAEVGNLVDENEFNDWYGNEHAPALLTVPGFINSLRYKASDHQTPTWLALYDLTSPSIATSEPYKEALGASAPDRERALIPKLKTLNRRVYELTFELGSSASDLSGTVRPAKFMLVTGIDILDAETNPAFEDEFNKWYNEEHIPDISKAKGWIRSRRFKLLSSVELASCGSDGLETPHAHKYLAFHEFDNGEMLTDPKFLEADRTEKRVAYTPKVSLGFRMVELYKEF